MSELTKQDIEVLGKIKDEMRTIDNPYFEYCAYGEDQIALCNIIEVGDCKNCGAYYKKMCKRGEQITEFLTEKEKLEVAVVLARLTENKRCQKEIDYELKEEREYKYPSNIDEFALRLKKRLEEKEASKEAKE